MSKKQPIITVEQDDEPIETDIKRFYFPATIKTTCKCGKPIAYHGTEHYLSYPKLNAPQKLVLWCEHCDAEREIKIRLSLRVEVVG